VAPTRCRVEARISCSLHRSRRALQVFIPWGVHYLAGSLRSLGIPPRHDKGNSPCPLAAPPGPCPIAGVSATPVGGEVHLQLRTAVARITSTLALDSAASYDVTSTRHGAKNDSTEHLQPYLTAATIAHPRARPWRAGSSFPQGSSPRGPSTQASLPASLLGAVLGSRPPAQSHTQIPASYRPRVAAVAPATAVTARHEGTFSHAYAPALTAAESCRHQR
jgi:hypothetical protein